VYFYELHEGDDDVFSDVLLVSDVEYSPEDFFDLVQSIRRRVQDTFEDDTLIEAIAVELEREHGFTFVTDDRLAAAVNVSRDEEDNFIAELGEDEDRGLDGEVDYRTVYADFEPPDEDSRPN
jgi:hypothetical protein